MPLFDRSIPSTSVDVESSAGEVDHRLMLRAYRAVGLAREGRSELVGVTLDSGDARPTTPSDGRVHLGADLVARTRVGDLTTVLAEALKDFEGQTRGPVDMPEGAHARVLMFENLFSDPDRPRQGQPRSMACGTFQLASALRADGADPVIVAGCLDDDDTSALDLALDGGARLVVITLLEACFEATQRLVTHIRSRSDCHVAVGGPMVTLAPEYVAAHLVGANLFVRGAGERILPRLSRLLATRVDDRIRQAMASLDGVLFIEGDHLTAGHPGRVNDVDPDTTAMDFTLMNPEHLGGGLSLETSRGCTNPCLFCTTPSRDAHRGRSGAVVGAHIGAYEDRLAELHGEHIPRTSLRLQICDDDFTCDSRRAREVIEAIATTGMKLSAFQASVRDFIVHDPDGFDTELLDAIRPALFQDAEKISSLGVDEPLGQLPSDVGSFVHLGVEAFDDANLRRLGKGYRARDAMALVSQLDRRGIVHDAYLILSGPGTTLDDLATTFLNLARLKIEHPRTFFMRIPMVPFVVPVFPSKSYELWTRRISSGKLDGTIELESTLHEEGFEEWDYPLVSRSVPGDPDVLDICENWQELIEPDPYYTRPLSNLAARLRERLPSVQDPVRAAKVRRVVRRISNAHERLVYEGIARNRRHEMQESTASHYFRATAGIGNPREVARRARNALDVGDPRLVVIPTHDCSLRCSYCPMDKTDGMFMSPEVLDGAIELLFSGSHEDVILQFFGGEALLRREFVLEGMDRALHLAKEAQKRVGFILSTNGLSLDEELIERVSNLPVKIEISIDGPPEVHNRHRRPRDKGVDSHDMATRWAKKLQGSNIPHEVIMVVTPATVDRLCESFAHVASLGFERIQVNHALAVKWSKKHKETFAAQLMAISERFYADALPEGVELIDLKTFNRPMLLNGEITVDHDGSLYYGNGFLVRTADPARFRAGHLDDLENLDTYLAHRPDNDYLIEHTYPEDMAANNLSVGRIYGSFVKHMRERFPELATPTAVKRPSTGHPR